MACMSCLGRMPHHGHGGPGGPGMPPAMVAVAMEAPAPSDGEPDMNAPYPMAVSGDDDANEYQDDYEPNTDEGLGALGDMFSTQNLMIVGVIGLIWYMSKKK